MNEHHCILPVDILHRPEIMAWETAQHPKEAVVLLLWLDLANLARSTGRAGFIPAGHVGHLRIHRALIDSGAAGAVPLLVTVEGGFFCRCFAADNQHLDASYLPPRRKGSLSGHVGAQMRQAQQAAAQELLLLTPEQCKDASGNVIPMADQAAGRSLIINLDRALGLPPRPAAMIPPGLIGAAAEAAKVSGPELMREVLIWITHLRSRTPEHSALPRTTEEALEAWHTLVAACTKP